MNGNDAVRGDAGRELDALVAERIMGALWWRSSSTGHRALFLETPPYWFTERADGTERRVGDWDTYGGFPAYSTDIAAAWRVVEQMREHPDPRRRTLRLVAYSYNRTYATFDAEADSEDWSEANGEHATPLAICRAALAATAESVTPNPRSFVAEPAAPHAVPSEEGEG